MTTLRSRAIRLAYRKPELRSTLLPLLKQAKVSIVQRGTVGYSTELLTDLATRIAQSLGGAHLKIRIEMRSKARAPGAHFSALKNGWHIIHLEKRNMQSLSGIAADMAHEMTHALQFDEGRLKTAVVDGVLGHEWKGTFYSDDAPYRSLPWELEAREAEPKGEAVLHQMKSQGIDLRSQGEKIRPDEGPTFGDLEGKSPDEVLEIWKKLQAKGA